MVKVAFSFKSQRIEKIVRSEGRRLAHVYLEIKLPVWWILRKIVRKVKKA